MNQTHSLKIYPVFFEALCDEENPKTFEIRKNDRDYKVGDTLIMCECEDGYYSGESVVVTVTYVTDFMQQPGYVVLGIR